MTMPAAKRIKDILDLPPLPFVKKDHRGLAVAAYNRYMDEGLYPPDMFPYQTVSSRFYSVSADIGGVVSFKIMDMPTFCGGFHVMTPRVHVQNSISILPDLCPQSLSDHYDRIIATERVSMAKAAANDVVFDVDKISGREWPQRAGAHVFSRDLQDYAVYSIVHAWAALAAHQGRSSVIGVDHSGGVLWPFIKFVRDYGTRLLMPNVWGQSYGEGRRVETRSDVVAELRSRLLVPRHNPSSPHKTTTSVEVMKRHKNPNSSNLCAWINFVFQASTTQQRGIQPYTPAIRDHITAVSRGAISTMGAH